MPITYQGNFEPLARDFLIKLIQNDAYCSSLLGDRFGSSHPYTLAQPIYPAGVLSRQGRGADQSVEQIDQPFYVVDLYSQSGVLELDQIYKWADDHGNPQGIFSLFHKKTYGFTGGTIDGLYEVWQDDAMYDAQLRLWHLTARYSAVVCGHTITTP